jgi:hypothetical protein
LNTKSRGSVRDRGDTWCSCRESKTGIKKGAATLRAAYVSGDVGGGWRNLQEGEMLKKNRRSGVMSRPSIGECWWYVVESRSRKTETSRRRGRRRDRAASGQAARRWRRVVWS